MSKFVVIVFPDETRAYQGTRALKELHAEASLTLYGMAVVAKDPEGKFWIKQSADPGPVGTAVGALVGGLLGVIGGPIGVLAGATGGTMIGSLTDLFNYGVGADFIDKVANELAPGKTAVVAEIDETWTTPLDARIEGMGGTVLRTWRADFEDEQVAKEVAANRAAFEQLRAEYAQASGEAKARLKAKLDQAKADLVRSEKRLEAKLDALGKEANGKIAELQRQITDAKASAKMDLDQRIAAMRADYEARSAKLKQAWTLTKEALAA
jgi:uncharacterized membrane protein